MRRKHSGIDSTKPCSAGRWAVRWASRCPAAKKSPDTGNRHRQQHRRRRHTARVVIGYVSPQTGPLAAFRRGRCVSSSSGSPRRSTPRPSWSTARRRGFHDQAGRQPVQPEPRPARSRRGLIIGRQDRPDGRRPHARYDQPGRCGVRGDQDAVHLQPGADRPRGWPVRRTSGRSTSSGISRTSSTCSPACGNTLPTNKGRRRAVAERSRRLGVGAGVHQGAHRPRATR